MQCESVCNNYFDYYRTEWLRQHRSGDRRARSLRLHFGDLRFVEIADAIQSGQAPLRGCAGFLMWLR